MKTSKGKNIVGKPTCNQRETNKVHCRERSNKVTTKPSLLKVDQTTDSQPSKQDQGVHCHSTDSLTKTFLVQVFSFHHLGLIWTVNSDFVLGGFIIQNKAGSSLWICKQYSICFMSLFLICIVWTQARLCSQWKAATSVIWVKQRMLLVEVLRD